MANQLYAVTYQVHLPNNTPGANPPDVYRNAPVEVLVIAAAQDQATLSAVINNNQTLNPGEVFDILQVEQVPLADKPLYQ
jgi:hypothetical protein